MEPKHPVRFPGNRTRNSGISDNSVEHCSETLNIGIVASQLKLVRMRELCLLFLLNLITSSSPVTASEKTITDYSPEGIHLFLNSHPEVDTKVAFVKSLPAEVKRNWIMMAGSESTQSTDCFQPRLLLPSQGANFIAAISTAKDKKGAYLDQNVEMLRFFRNGSDAAFGFSSLDFHKRDSGKAYNLDGKGESCRECHGTNPRPNWEAYDSWPNMLPVNADRIYEGSEEEKAFKYTLLALKDDPIFKQLELPQGVELAKIGESNGKAKYEVKLQYDYLDGYHDAPSQEILPDGTKIQKGGRYFLFKNNRTGGSHRGDRLFADLTILNSHRISTEIRKSKGFDRFKYALKAAIEGCISNEQDLKNYLPETVFSSYVKSLGMNFDELVVDTKQRRDSLSRRKFEFSRTITNGLSRAMHSLRGKNIAKRNWSAKCSKRFFGDGK